MVIYWKEGTDRSRLCWRRTLKCKDEEVDFVIRFPTKWILRAKLEKSVFYATNVCARVTV